MNYGLWWILLDFYDHSLIMVKILLFIAIVLKVGVILIADDEDLQTIYKGDTSKLKPKLKTAVLVEVIIFLILLLLPSKKVLIEAFVIQKSANVINKSHKLSDSEIGKIIDLSVQKIENALNSSK